MDNRAPIGILLAAALGAAPLAGCFSERQPTGAELDCETPAQPVVVIRDFAFRADCIRIAPGQSVTWVNEEPGTDAHTSTSDDGRWDSPLLQPGDSFTVTFEQAGRFPYHCTPHPTMQGVVLVE